MFSSFWEYIIMKIEIIWGRMSKDNAIYIFSSNMRKYWFYVELDLEFSSKFDILRPFE